MLSSQRNYNTFNWYFLRSMEKKAVEPRETTIFFTHAQTHTKKKKIAITLNKNTCFMMLQQFWFPLLLCEFLGHVKSQPIYNLRGYKIVQLTHGFLLPGFL